MDGQPQRTHKSWASRIGISRRLRRNNDRPIGVETLEQQRRKLSKNPADGLNELGERKYSIFSGDSATLHTQDPTDMIHGLSIRDSSEDLVGDDLEYGLWDENDPRLLALRRRREAMLSAVPRGIWEIIAAYLSPADTAQLALASKILLDKLGDQVFVALDHPENQSEKLQFLSHLDRRLPNHLLCFVCARYHRRIHPGLEKLPTAVSENPVVSCKAANLRISSSQRTKLTHSRILPYTFVQLPLRAHRFGQAYGVPADRMAREWTQNGSLDGSGPPRWRHSTRYLVDATTRHLLLRVRSHTFATPHLPPAGMRQVLYERAEYTPYFSVCAHWADGELLAVCKCALGHVPEVRPRGVAAQLQRGPHALAHDLVHTQKAGDGARECSFCQPARRCPKCPSEYLVKITMVEDRNARDPHALFRFALVVTRYVDLGDGSGPGRSPEWDAAIGKFDGYDSIAMVGKRSIMGTFESIANGAVPGMPLLKNMNPKMRTGGRDGD